MACNATQRPHLLSVAGNRRRGDAHTPISRFLLDRLESTTLRCSHYTMRAFSRAATPIAPKAPRRLPLPPLPPFPPVCYPSCSRGVAQLGSAPAWGAGGRWFKSSLPDQRQASLGARFPLCISLLSRCVAADMQNGAFPTLARYPSLFSRLSRRLTRLTAHAPARSGSPSSGSERASSSAENLLGASGENSRNSPLTTT